MIMLTSEFDYSLPENFIAHEPEKIRDQSKLMIVKKNSHEIFHKKFFEITQSLKAGDVLVWNNSKVFKARLRGTLELDQESDGIAKRKTTGNIINSSTVEIFLVRPVENRMVWRVMARPGRKLRLGIRVRFAPDFSCEIIMKEKDGTFLVQFEDDDVVVRAKANKYGEVPTPPYINVLNRDQQNNRYQTVYASHEGSVAAPTAGFHFTPGLIEKLKDKGVEFAEFFPVEIIFGLIAF